MAEIRAVFFDVGGTLAYPHPSFVALFAQVCQRHGLPISPEDAQRAEPAVWARIAERVDAGRGFSLSAEQSRAFWYWVYRAFLAETGHPQFCDTDLPQRLFETFTGLDSYRLYDDALATLDRLKAAGLVLGVISNWEDWLEQLMVHLRIRHYFNVAAISSMIGVEKPSPEIFVRALQAAGVGPQDAVHVGDNLRDDVEGAEAVGIRGVLLDRRDRFAPLIPGVGGQGTGHRGQGTEEPRTGPQPPTPGPQPLRIRTLWELPPLLGLA